MTLTQREASAAYRVGWLVVSRVPESWARWVFRQIADILWRRQGKGVQQLEANLRRVVPGATGKLGSSSWSRPGRSSTPGAEMLPRPRHAGRARAP